MTTNRRKQFGIMKAQVITDQLIQKIGTACIAQPKLRGQRCRVQWVGGNPILISSYGIPFTFMEHIQQALIDSNISKYPYLQFDGELYRHEKEFTQEHINSICNRSKNRHPDSEKIQLHIFDIVSTDPQWLRLMIRDQFLKTVPQHFPLIEVPYRVIQSKEWVSHCQEFITKGYEGVILRRTDGLYKPLDILEQAKRPQWILKFKPGESDTYEIIDYREGTGWAIGMLGAVLVRGKDSDPFWVGTGNEFTKENRQNYWRIRDKLLGSKIVVKHEKIRTINSIPICTSGHKIIWKE